MGTATFPLLSAFAKAGQAAGVAARVSAIASALLFPFAAAGKPVTLKLSFFTSDQSAAYVSCVKPFVDAVNLDGAELLHIEVFLSGTLGKTQKEPPELVRSGGADIALVVPGQNPELFPDTEAMELPGLFRDAREATLAYTRLIAAGSVTDFKDFVVIGAYGAEPSSIQSRKPLTSLVDLTDQKIRSNNEIMSAALAKLGATPVVIAYNETALAIAKGTIDGAAVDVATMLDVGTSRLAGNHFMLPIGSAPLALLMNRQAFERLPEDAKALIVRYSGEWTAARYIDATLNYKRAAIEMLKGDSRRTYAVPSDSDSDRAKAAFASVQEAWANASPRNRELLKDVEAELSKLRDGK
jgi:TRAP-type transport system periplasmic protein